MKGSASDQLYLKNAFSILMAAPVPLPVPSESDGDEDMESAFSMNTEDYEADALEDLAYRTREDCVDLEISYEEFERLYYDDFEGSDRAFRDFWFERGWDDRYWWSRLYGSHYLAGRQYSSRGPGAIVKYETRRETDLKEFVIQRGLKDPYPAGVTMKYYYIRLLERADRQWTFDFLGLPAEMRLFVYRHLLLFPRPKQMMTAYGCLADVNILGTCRLVHKEASDVLYKENTFLTHASVTAQNYKQVSRYARVHKRNIQAHCDHAPAFRLPGGIDDFPDFFRRITRLHIDLSYDIQGNTDVAADGDWPLNHFLFSLASFLMDGHKLKNLHLKLNFPDQMDDKRFPAILFPLRRLRNIPTLTIEGSVPKVVSRRLQSDLASTEPTFNTLRFWKLLEAEFEQQISLFAAIDGICDCGECSFSINFDAMMGVYGQLAVGKRECCYGSLHEENFIARLGHLRETLDRTDTAAVQQALDRVSETRQAMRDYEAVTDDGRLEEAHEIWRRKLFVHGLKSGAEDDDWADDAEISRSPTHSPEL